MLYDFRPKDFTNSYSYWSMTVVTEFNMDQHLNLWFGLLLDVDFPIFPVITYFEFLMDVKPNFHFGRGFSKFVLLCELLTLQAF